MSKKIRVAILDDHQSIIDGYQYRLLENPDIEVVATTCYGDGLVPMLETHPIDVLLLDVSVPTSENNPNPYPILYEIPKLLAAHSDLSILVISMHEQRTLIKSILEAGASGYILKDDQSVLKKLGTAIESVANGGVFFSKAISDVLLDTSDQSNLAPTLTPRQSEILSILVAYPDMTTADVANYLDIAHSTARNLLSGAYLRLGVRNKTAAITEARRLGLVTPVVLPTDL